MARLRWLAAHIAVPAVLHFERSEEDAWLFTEEVEGRTLYQLLEAGTDPEILVDAAAVFLRQLHAIPAESCPFASDHRLRLLAAHERMSEGLVDSGDFDEEREGLTPEAVWAQMNALLPLISDSVVTHGDFSLDNLIWRDGGIVACIDVGRAGLADRYQDLAILWNGLGEFGPAMQRRLFEAYGIEAVDRARLDFHLMLDEFF